MTDALAPPASAVKSLAPAAMRAAATAGATIGAARSDAPTSVRFPSGDALGGYLIGGASSPLPVVAVS